MERVSHQDSPLGEAFPNVDIFLITNGNFCHVTIID